MSDPSASGAWATMPFNSEVLAIHAALLHGGKVLFFAGSGNSRTRFNDHGFGDTTRGIWSSVVWDPAGAPGAGDFFHPETPREPSGEVIDLFCGGATYLPDGTVLAAGGTYEFDVPNAGPGLPGRREALGFDVGTQQWTHLALMAAGRWYPSLVTLGDGRVLASGGFTEAETENRVLNETLETYSASTGAWQQLLTPPGFVSLPLYAHLFLLASGAVCFSGGKMDDPRLVEPCILDVTRDPVVVQPIPGLRDVASRDQSASVVLPPAQDQRVMVMGGGPGDEGDATDAVDIVDLGEEDPQYRPAAPMHLARIHLNAVLLPDRTVLVVGGSRRREQRDVAALAAEIYDPETNTWTEMAEATVPRLYHATALLLPDGRVVTASGNPPPFGQQVPWEPPDPNEELQIELYSPPYLFAGPRPTIGSVPAAWRYGQMVDVSSPEAGDIRFASLLRGGVTTHSYDTSQRLVELPITRQADGLVQVAVTAEANIAPPGWYMLFLTDNQGVPSVASWVHLGAGPAGRPPSAYAKMVLATSSLASYWPLDEPEGTIAFDAAGSDHASYVNGPALALAGPGPGSSAVGFNGTDQYVRTSRPVGDDFSLELWFSSQGGEGHGNDQWWQGSGLFDGEVPGATDDFGTSLDADGRVWAGTGNPDVSVHSPPGFNDGAWHHVVFTRERASGRITLYLDGAAVGSAQGGTQSLTAPPGLRLGLLQTGNHGLNGLMAHAAVYALPLSATTVREHSQALP